MMPRPKFAAAPEMDRSCATVTRVPPLAGAQRRGDRHLGLAAAPVLRARGPQHHPVRRLVGLEDLALPEKFSFTGPSAATTLPW